MAREKLVTRTIKTTKLEVLGLNTETSAAETRTFIISGEFLSDKQALKELLCADGFVPVKVVSHDTREDLYGMTEAKFIANAELLPPRKQYETED